MHMYQWLLTVVFLTIEEGLGLFLPSKSYSVRESPVVDSPLGPTQYGKGKNTGLIRTGLAHIRIIADKCDGLPEALMKLSQRIASTYSNDSLYRAAVLDQFGFDPLDKEQVTTYACQISNAKNISELINLVTAGPLPESYRQIYFTWVQEFYHQGGIEGMTNNIYIKDHIHNFYVEHQAQKGASDIHDVFINLGEDNVVGLLSDLVQEYGDRFLDLTFFRSGNTTTTITDIQALARFCVRPGLDEYKGISPPLSKTDEDDLMDYFWSCLYRSQDDRFNEQALIDVLDIMEQIGLMDLKQ